jgi:hypothetical protein
MRDSVKNLAPLWVTLVLITTACKGTSSGSPYFNYPAPSGTVVASGNFTGTVTGSVLVYDQGNGNYIIRLANLQTPSETDLQLQTDTTTAGSRICTQGLVSFTGNVNYSCDPGFSTGFSVVYIHSPSGLDDPGIASLTPQD